MWKPFVGLVALGLGGFVLYEIFLALILPLLGGLLGFLLKLVKIGFLLLVVWIAYKLINRSSRRREAEVG